MMGISGIRKAIGATALAVGLVLNEWVLAALFSADGSFWLTTRIAIWGFDLGMIAIGLLLLFAGRQLLVNLFFSIVLTAVLLITLDLIARPLLRDKLYYRPEGVYKHRWPEMPALARYDAKIRYSGINYGDLAAVSGLREARDPRPVEFITDDYGFRNATYDTTKALDLIMLGDSFGAGVGTTQENTWCSLLASKYGLHCYNLSIDGTGPWQEYMTLKLELPRLHCRPGTTVVWALYVGNDLENPEGHDPQLAQRNGWLGRMKVRAKSFFRRSPLKLFFDRILAIANPSGAETGVVSKRFLDGRDVLFFKPFEAASKRTSEQVMKYRDFSVYESVLDSMRVLAEREQLRIAVVIIPTKEEAYGWLLHDQSPWTSDKTPSAFAAITDEECRQRGFSVLDMKSDLIDSSSQAFVSTGKLLWWHDDIHWNERGNALAADLVYNRFFKGQSPASEFDPLHLARKSAPKSRS